MSRRDSFAYWVCYMSKWPPNKVRIHRATRLHCRIRMRLEFNRSDARRR